MHRPFSCFSLSLVLILPAVAQMAESPTTLAAAKANPVYTVTGNLSITNQYVFRGLTQTDGKPALQGGIDYAHSGGFYFGTWLSNISWYTDQNAGVASAPVALASPGSVGAPYLPRRSNSANLEWDLYGGYKRTYRESWTIDTGIIGYYYPGIYDNTGAYRQPHTVEIYGLVGYEWLALKFSRVLGGHLFGVHDSAGASYTDATLTIPLKDSGYKVVTHAGHQHYPSRSNVGYWGLSGGNNSFFSYTDYKLGITKELGNFTCGLNWTYADTKQAAPDGETTAYMNAFGNNIGRRRIALTVARNF